MKLFLCYEIYCDFGPSWPPYFTRLDIPGDSDKSYTQYRGLRTRVHNPTVSKARSLLHDTGSGYCVTTFIVIYYKMATSRKRAIPLSTQAGDARMCRRCLSFPLSLYDHI